MERKSWSFGEPDQGRTATRPHEDREGGFALVLAILALMLLTFLGLTLATTTSTELQIATNYRWSQQALYNAEAGVEAAKVLLRAMDFNAVLYQERGAFWTGQGPINPNAPGGGAAAPLTRNDQWGNASRNFDNWDCDLRGNGVGYGVVLDDGSAEAPYQYKTTVFGQSLNGAFTLWVRRPLRNNPPGSGCDGCWDDYPSENALILVSEGVAPYAKGAGATAFGVANRAVQMIEVTLSNTAAAGAPPGCTTRGGQQAGGPSGGNFDPCGALGAGADITAGLGGAATGGGGELTPGQQ